MTEHTPGPWHVSFRGPAPMVEREDGHPVCLLEDVRTGGEKRPAANARLIAAAPDLLNGCNALLGLIQLVRVRSDITPELREVLHGNHRIAEAEAAIAKAAESREGDSRG